MTWSKNLISCTLYTIAINYSPYLVDESGDEVLM